MTIQELYDKRAKVVENMRAHIEAHTRDNGTLSAEDTQAYEKMEAEVKDLTDSIKREEQLAAIEASLSKTVGTPVVNKPDSGSKTEPAKPTRATDEYKAAMLDAFRTKFNNTAEILREGSDADGGYLVPEEYDRRLIDVLSDSNIMRGLATKITTSGLHKINIAGNKPAAAWVDEGEELTFSDAKFSQTTMDAHKLVVAVKVTEELLYDNAFNLESYLLRTFGEALGNAEEDVCMTGNGSGKPTGIFDATNGGTQAITTATITADKLIDLTYALKRPYRKNAAFILNDATIASIRKLKDGAGAYLWQPSFTAGEADRLLGYPVYTSAYAPTNGVAFGDFKYYNIGDRGTRSFAKLTELYATSGVVAFIAKERIDAKLILKEAVQILTISSSNS